MNTMRILTVVRMVPDSQATITVTPDGLGIETGNLKCLCDPFDEFGAEQAVRLKESRGDVEEVVALTFGPPPPATQDQALRSALAFGADRGIYVCIEQADSHIAHNELHLASLAAAAIRDATPGFDLILCGKLAIDNDSGEFGPALAEFLDWPHIGAVTQLNLAEDGSTLCAHRRIEGGEEVVKSHLPTLLTCEKGLVEPRYPALPNIIKAKKKPIEFVSANDLPGLETRSTGATLVRLTPPPPRPACTMIEGEPEQMARELVRLLHDEAKVI